MLIVNGHRHRYFHTLVWPLAESCRSNASDNNSFSDSTTVCILHARFFPRRIAMIFPHWLRNQFRFRDAGGEKVDEQNPGAPGAGWHHRPGLRGIAAGPAVPPNRSLPSPASTSISAKAISSPRAESYIYRISAKEIQAANAQGFSAILDYSRMDEMDAVVICVPTPLNQYHEPDLSFITDITPRHRAPPAGRPVGSSREYNLSSAPRKKCRPCQVLTVLGQ